MIIVTSLSPRHSNAHNQIPAVESWMQYGNCISLNNSKEIEQLESLYQGVNFVETKRTVEHLIGKPLVSINAMIDYAIEKKEDLLLINSDIIISNLPEFNNDGITIFSRYDYVNSFENSNKFEAGFDVFYIPNNFLNIFQLSIYAMGACFWDHWIPYKAILNNVRVYWYKEKYAFHKIHPIQYDVKEWEYIGEYFKWEFKIDKRLTIPQIATQTLSEINSRLIKL